MSFTQTSRFFKKIEKLLTDISWVVCLFITFMIMADVMLRFFLNKPLPATWEISEICMPYIVFFPFAFTASINGHVKVTMIYDLVSARVRLVFDMIANAVCFLMTLLITYWAWLRFAESFRIGEEILAAVSLPWWIGKMAMPIGIGMFSIRYLLMLIENIDQFSKGRTPQISQSNICG